MDTLSKKKDQHLKIFEDRVSESLKHYHDHLTIISVIVILAGIVNQQVMTMIFNVCPE